MKKKLLLIYASYGTGHKAVAHSIGNYFIDSDEVYEILIVDLIQETSPIFGRISKKLMEKIIVNKNPIFWEIMYRAFDHKLSTIGSNVVFSKLYDNKQIKKLISDFNPDITISTHYFGSTLISAYNKKKIINTKLITIVTDYKAHQLWLKNHKDENAIIVNSEEEKKILIKKNISSKKIYTFGIPIYGERFIVTKTKEEILNKFKFDSKLPFILFIGGGGYESSASFPYFKNILKLNLKANVLYVCGASSKLKLKADELMSTYNAPNVHVTGFVNNMGELLSCADFVITKPGGAIISECLYFQKPMLLINKTGGQETDNYRYLVNKKIGLRANNKKEFQKKLNSLLNNPKILKKLNKNMQKFERKDAIVKIYNLTEEILKENE